MFTDNQWTDTVWVAKRQQAIACDHGDNGVGTARAPVNTGDRGKNSLRIEPLPFRRLCQFMRQHVE